MGPCRWRTAPCRSWWPRDDRWPPSTGCVAEGSAQSTDAAGYDSLRTNIISLIVISKKCHMQRYGGHGDAIYERVKRPRCPKRLRAIFTCATHRIAWCLVSVCPSVRCDAEVRWSYKSPGLIWKLSQAKFLYSLHQPWSQRDNAWRSWSVSSVLEKERIWKTPESK